MLYVESFYIFSPWWHVLMYVSPTASRQSVLLLPLSYMSFLQVLPNEANSFEAKHYGSQLSSQSFRCCVSVSDVLHCWLLWSTGWGETQQRKGRISILWQLCRYLFVGNCHLWNGTSSWTEVILVALNSLASAWLRLCLKCSFFSVFCIDLSLKFNMFSAPLNFARSTICCATRVRLQ